MSTATTLLAVAGALAVLLRLVRALFASLRGTAEAFLAGDLAGLRAGRGDLTGQDEAREQAALAGRRRLIALGVASMWAGLLVVPLITPWPRGVYALYSLLWLVPHRERHAPSA